MCNTDSLIFRATSVGSAEMLVGQKKRKKLSWTNNPILDHQMNRQMPASELGDFLSELDASC